MENLTTQSSLRSLDESGRPLTAGRPSYPEARESSFDGHLERARAETREEERIAEQRDDRREVSDRRERTTQRSSERSAERRDEARGESEAGQEPGVDEPESRGTGASEADGAGDSDESSGQTETGENQADQDQADDHAASQLAVAPAELDAEPLVMPGLAAQASVEAGHELPVEAVLGQEAGPKAGSAASVAAAAGVDPGARAAAPSVTGAENAPVQENKVTATESAKPQAEAIKAPVDPERIARAESVLNQIRMRLGGDLRTATLALQPAELGRLKVLIKVEAGSVRAELRVESAEAMAALERHVPELRAMLSSDGLELADVSIGLAPEGEFDQATDNAFGREPGSDGSPNESEEVAEPSASLTRALADEAGVDFLA